MIREKLELRKPGFQFCRYIVSVKGNTSDFVAAQDSIWRDRKAFTKQMLRQFLRKTISREAWSGAPWIVDDKLARIYKLDLEVPPEKRYDAQQAARKASAAIKKQEQNNSFNSFAGQQQQVQQQRPQQQHQQYQHHQQVPHPPNSQRYPNIKPAGKAQKMKPLQANSQIYVSPHLHPQAQTISQVWVQDASTAPLGTQMQGNPFSQIYPSYSNFPKGQHPNVHGMIGQATHPHHQSSLPLIPAKDRVVEDLELPYTKGERRPELKFFSKDVPKGAKATDKDHNVLMKSIGPLLQIWDTLNVHTGPEGMFPLDSFTFDDLVEAMVISSPEIDCELFNEIHCAVLKQLVDEDGDFHVLGFAESEDEDESDESGDESDASTSPIPDPATAPPARSTRSSLAKSEAAALRKRTPTPELPQNQAAEMLEDYGWLERLKDQDLQDGGWEVIMVGFLRKVMLNGQSPTDKEKCEEILAHLAPVDADPTQETARMQYAIMDVNMRVDALEMACVYACRTPKFKRYLDGCAKAMTQTRNRKMELQRTRKTL